MTENEKKENLADVAESADDRSINENPQATCSEETLLNIEPDDSKQEAEAPDEVIEEEDAIDVFANEEKLKQAEAEIQDEIMKKRKRRIAGFFIGFMAFVVFAGSVGFGIYTFIDIQSKRYVMEFAGEKISAEELKLFMIFFEGDTESAKSTLTDYLVYGYAADKFGVTISEDRKQEVLDYVEGIKGQISELGYEKPKISDERYLEMFSVGFVVDEIMAEVTKDIQFSESEFNEFLTLYREYIKLYYSAVNVKCVVTDTEETAFEAKKALEQGIEPDEVIKEFSSLYDENVEIDVYSLSDLGLDEASNTAVMDLDIGGSSDVIAVGEELYAVFIMVEKQILTDDEIADIAKSEFELMKESEYFSEKLDEYEEEANITFNEKAVSSIELKEITANTTTAAEGE